MTLLLIGTELYLITSENVRYQNNELSIQCCYFVRRFRG